MGALNIMEQKVDKKIQTWLQEEKARIVANGNPENTEWHDKLYADQVSHFNRLAKGIKNLVSTGKEDISLQREWFPYFENLSNNRATAFLFQTYSEVKVGSTNKSGKDAFFCFFGDALKIELEKEIEAAKNAEEQEKQLEEERKESAKNSYFSMPLWNKNAVKKLTPAQYGRVTKMLDKLFRYESGVMSLKENLESLDIKCKEMTDNMYKWNRRRFNAMSGDEQRAYEARLKNGRSFDVHFTREGKSFIVEVQKMIFNLLEAKDTTPEELK